MKSFKAVSLAVAVALAGAAGVASAAPATDDYLFVFDPTTNASFVADIGAPYTSGPTANINLSSFSAWSQFVAGATGPASGWDFAILGGSTGTGAGDISQISTYPVTTGEYASTDLENIYGVTSLTAANAFTGNSIYTNSSTAAYSFLNTIYDGGAGDAGSLVGNSIYATGTGVNALDLYYQNASGTVTLLSGATLVANGLSSQVDFSSTTVAVPEPETYGLMMAGLLAVGAIVRRRSRA